MNADNKELCFVLYSLFSSETRLLGQFLIELIIFSSFHFLYEISFAFHFLVVFMRFLLWLKEFLERNDFNFQFHQLKRCCHESSLFISNSYFLWIIILWFTASKLKDIFLIRINFLFIWSTTYFSSTLSNLFFFLFGLLFMSFNAIFLESIFHSLRF